MSCCRDDAVTSGAVLVSFCMTGFAVFFQEHTWHRDRHAAFLGAAPRAEPPAEQAGVPFSPSPRHACALMPDDGHLTGGGAIPLVLRCISRMTRDRDHLSTCLLACVCVPFGETSAQVLCPLSFKKLHTK